jgi:hypothetical protein
MNLGSGCVGSADALIPAVRGVRPYESFIPSDHASAQLVFLPAP